MEHPSHRPNLSYIHFEEPSQENIDIFGVDNPNLGGHFQVCVGFQYPLELVDHLSLQSSISPEGKSIPQSVHILKFLNNLIS